MYSCKKPSACGYTLAEEAKRTLKARRQHAQPRLRVRLPTVLAKIVATNLAETTSSAVYASFDSDSISDLQVTDALADRDDNAGRLMTCCVTFSPGKRRSVLKICIPNAIGSRSTYSPFLPLYRASAANRQLLGAPAY